VTTHLQLLRLISKTLDFFAVLAARRQQASAGAGSDVDEELYKYLSDQSTDVTALNCYPLTRKLYIELNTGLPASATAERLFTLEESFLSSAI